MTQFVLREEIRDCGETEAGVRETSIILGFLPGEFLDSMGVVPPGANEELRDEVPKALAVLSFSLDSTELASSRVR